MVVILGILLIGGVYFVIDKKFIGKEAETLPINSTHDDPNTSLDPIEKPYEEEPNTPDIKDPNDPIEEKPNIPFTYPKLKTIEGTRKIVGKSAKGYDIVNIDGLTYIEDYLIVNKTYGLPSTYIPTDTKQSCVGKTSTCNKCINNTAYDAFLDMQADAAALGLNIYISSGYRPYVGQESIYNRYIKRDGQKAADTYSARPGYSEHQSSLCFDLNSINDSFSNTKEGIWVNNNAYIYGFIIRFPKNKQEITGYKYESWHLRYVGTDLSYKLYNDGDWLSLEEYFGIDSKYQD